MKLHLEFLLILLLAGTFLNAQEVIPASGNNASGSFGSISYTIGQCLYTTENLSQSGSVAKGIQQPFEIYIITGMNDLKNINLTVSAYPNPVLSNLKLQVDSPFPKRLIFQLSDARGNLLRQEHLSGKISNISMEKLPPAVYFLRISENKKVLKSFKIIKK